MKHLTRKSFLLHGQYRNNVAEASWDDRPSDEDNVLIPWQAIYAVLGMQATLDYMVSLDALVLECRRFAVWATEQYLWLLIKEESKQALTAAKGFAQGLVTDQELEKKRKAAIRTGREFDYDTEQLYRQANAAVIWAAGTGLHFAPSEVIRRLQLVDSMLPENHDQTVHGSIRTRIEKEFERIIGFFDEEIGESRAP
ncbi:hypothetical protein EV673_0364 [Limnobacter thiooxidans]|uniref:Uncharacterized protein n=1 Tax=Limnobacter thiooxidans TaxID=131080 RepID=A0AA86J031_9BURK|nr:hypothetical protein EV673_0364 [Limnobacter thiooxidans]BET26523.1 hypothetical protein RGQ30_20240 [Limnobacter thiooxidans]